MPIGRPREFAAALALASISGVAGLAHQILWTRRLVDVLGASAGTFSKVVGAFFIGLALGAWLSSRPNATDAPFWKRVALAELAVAALALPILFSAEFAQWLYQRTTPGAWMKWLLPLLLVTPPATAMGLVVPWMVRAMAANDWFAPRHPVWLYAVNTLSGVLGIVFTLLQGLPRLGLTGAGVSAIGLNVCVAVGAFLLSRSGSSRREETHLSSQIKKQSLLTSAPTEKWIFLLAFASGFLVLALEVVVQHQLAQITINSLFSSGLVLVLVLVSLGMAAMLVPWLTRTVGNERRALALTLLASAVLCALQPFLLTGLRSGVNILPYELPPTSYVWEVIKLGLLAICPMLLAGGLVFPLLLRSVANVEGGRRVGVLFAWNGLGGWLGAELGQVWLAPAFGLWQSVALIAGGYLVMLLIAALFAKVPLNVSSETTPRSFRRFNVVASLTATLIVAVSLALTGQLPQATVGPQERLHAFKVGREGAVAAVECGPSDWRMLFNNSYTLGGSKAQFNQERQAHLPLLLHGSAKTVATLGVATASTVAGAALHPNVERIDAIELSPLVLRYAEKFFSPYNRDVFRNPRVHFIEEDARWVIAAKESAYDVVIGDLFLPWRTGEARLFTREHFQNIRRSLRAGGLFCQWLPMFQLTLPQFEGIARTFQEVFPDAFLLRGDFYTELPILGLVGGRNLETMEWQTVEVACARLRAGGGVTDALVRHREGVAMMVIGPLPSPPPGPVNTLANAWLEWNAGENILGMKTPWFIGIPCAEYVREIHRSSITLIPPELRFAHDAGQFFLTLEVAAKLNLPALENLKTQTNDRIPASLRQDTDVDWQHWPMRVKPDSLMKGSKPSI